MKKPRPQGLVEAIKDQVNKTPDKEAFVFLYADRPKERISYEQLDANACRYAHALRSSGIQSGDLIILVFDHSYDLVAAFLGALYLGAIPSIFPYFTPYSSHGAYEGRVQELVLDVQAKAVVTSEKFKAPLSELLVATKCRLIDINQAIKQFEKVSSEPDFEVRTNSDTAYIQFSSGTTGLSKGTVLSHQAVLDHVYSLAEDLSFREDDVSVGWLPLYHDMGLIAQLFMPLLTGALSVLISPFHWVRCPRVHFEAIDQYKGTVSWMPNFAFKHAVRNTPEKELSGLDLSSWRLLINASEPVHLAQMIEFAEHLTPYGFSFRALSIVYGMAEVVLVATHSPLDQLPDVDWVSLSDLQSTGKAVPATPGSTGARGITSCGYAKSDTEIKIIDESGRQLAERQVGEVLIRCPSLFDGYYRHPELTAEALQDGWLHSGDMGYMVDQQLYICDRKKDLIIVGGQNIYPDHLEAQTKKSLGENGGRVVAFGLEDQELGTELPVIVCEMKQIPKGEGRELLIREIGQGVSQEFDLILADIRFVRRGWIQKTTSGKLARAATRQKYLDEGFKPNSGPLFDATSADIDSPPAQTESVDGDTEQKVLALFQEIFGSKKVSLVSNFFELGAGSLHMIQLCQKVEEQFNQPLSTTDVFRYPNIRALAAYLQPGPVTGGAAQKVGLERGKARRAVRSQRQRKGVGK